MYLPTIKSDLKSVFADYAKECKVAVDRSYHAMKAQLQPGQTVPNPGKISPEMQAEISGPINALRDKAIGIIDEALEEVKAVKAEAPTTEAVNAIAMLRDANSVTEGDLDALMNEYGATYLAHKAVRDIARKHKIYAFADHPIIEIEAGLNTLRHICERDITLGNAESTAARGSSGTLFNASVDLNLPE